jgi:hypothetical protein
LNRWIDNEIGTKLSNPAGTNRERKGKRGEEKGTRGGNDSEPVGRILLVKRKEKRDNLGFVAEILRKQWPERTIDEPGGENLQIARSPFPFEKTARNFTCGIRKLSVVNR